MDHKNKLVDLVNRSVWNLLRISLIVSVLGLILCLYLQQAVQHGLLQVMAAGGITPDVLIFNSFATIPIAVLLFWPPIERRWPGLYLAAIPFRGTRYLVDLTRWRAALIVSLPSLCLIEVLL